MVNLGILQKQQAQAAQVAPLIKNILKNYHQVLL